VDPSGTCIHLAVGLAGPLATTVDDVTEAAMARIRGTKLETKIYPGARHEIFKEINQVEVIDDVNAFTEGLLRVH
jgi:alpha-beta hydrolase superfamily lysophospholipase